MLNKGKALFFGVLSATLSLAAMGQAMASDCGELVVQGKCLEVGYGSYTQRHDVAHLAECNGSAAQQFTLAEDGSVHVQGWCLDVPNSYAVDHQIVQAFDCRDQLNQHFVRDGQAHLSVQGKCLDVPNANPVDGANIQLFDCRDQDNQRFTFVPHS